MAKLKVMVMNKKVPANLHKVEPVELPEVNAAVIFIGSIAIMVVALLMFIFMMDNVALLLQMI